MATKLVLVPVFVLMLAIGLYLFIGSDLTVNEPRKEAPAKEKPREVVSEMFASKTFPVSPPTRGSFLLDIKSRTIEDFTPIGQDIDEPLTVAALENFNSIHLAPRLESITNMDYFRFVKLNLSKKCNLWPDDSKCVLKDCGIQFCDESQLPPHLFEVRAKSEDKPVEEDCPSSESKKLSQINVTISSETAETMDSLFECSEHDNDDGQYIDLLLNPESYTGYKGESAHRIWRSIYEENCFFKNHHKMHYGFSLDNLCYEERIFYRALSGLHSSISIHLCSSYPLVDGTVSYNLKEFIKRFEGKEGYLKNLYFLFLLELRALHKSEQYLLSNVNWQSSGDLSVTRDAIRNLLKTVRFFKWHFNESSLFKKEPTVANEFAEHFQNITTNIMDCVACDKCKLWGKVQIHGLGTAFKILIAKDPQKLHLTRHEITALINALGRLSNSIRQLGVFEKMMNKR